MSPNEFVTSSASLVADSQAKVVNSFTGLVLIVDDTPANLEVISETLSDAGISVAIATSGDRALKQLERRVPDLILLDVTMPGIDGFETCRRIKQDARLRSIPIIFMTALSDPKNKIRALELGAVDYITKPFHESEVLARVKTHLQLYQLTQNLETQVAQKTEELRSSQIKLIQSEKMSALGNLVAGIAHEINNPVGCIVGNVAAIQSMVDDLFHLIEQYQKQYPQPSSELEEVIEDIDLDYLRDDIPKLLQALCSSGERIKSISRSLRIFSRAKQDHPQPFNLHEGLDSTLLILRHRLKVQPNRREIEVIKDYGSLPEIQCFPEQLNQVFMNLLANAIDAINAASEQAQEPELEIYQLTIHTQAAVDKVVVEISDNGTGIPENIQDRIFEHLFTTKSVDKGTGLGLAIARQIIVDQHQGQITIHSEVGQGTTFKISLPVSLSWLL